MAIENSPFLKNVLRENKEMLETIKKEILSPVKEKSCWDCNGKMKLIRTSEIILYTIDDVEKEIVVKNSPRYECENCKEIIGNFMVYADLEKAVNKEILFRLNRREEIPKEIDFLRLI